MQITWSDHRFAELLIVALPLAIAGLLAWIVRVQRRQLARVDKYPVPVVDP